MKTIIILLFFCLPIGLSAQNPCDWATNVSDSIGTFQATKDYIMYERNFGATASYIFMTLQLSDGTPLLNVRYLKKSNDFITANCFDKNSRLYLQLDNGKIVTLLHIEKESCGNNLVSDGKFNMVNDGTFLFVKGTVDDLKSSPVSLMRIRFVTETIDYPLASEFKSELTGEIERPQRYFIENLKCLIP